jgi:hypothetical protein
VSDGGAAAVSFQRRRLGAATNAARQGGTWRTKTAAKRGRLDDTLTFVPFGKHVQRRSGDSTTAVVLASRTS